MKCARPHPGTTGALLSSAGPGRAGPDNTEEGGTRGSRHQESSDHSKPDMGISTLAWESGFLGHFGYINPIPPGRVTIVTMLQNHHLQKPKIIFFRILFRE